jgi:hypothetical protein
MIILQIILRNSNKFRTNLTNLIFNTKRISCLPLKLIKKQTYFLIGKENKAKMRKIYKTKFLLMIK